MQKAPPGAWQPQNHDVTMMVCTAGHVDHGKTSLVRWLTGCETDRLIEEKQRALTIEPGFAPCSTLHGISVGITDVPGHEKFIKNMVAGVSGVGLCILVIAADDGIMPQTIEHTQIMQILGIENGLVALTKKDLVDPATLEARRAQIHEWLESTFLAGAPVCPLSSATGEGVIEFHQAFSDLVASARQREHMGVFRMPVERVFTMEGFGRVISGVPVAGTVCEGDLLELVPGGARGRVRGMQCFGRSARQGHPGLCMALNMPDLARVNPHRGQVLCEPGRLQGASLFHARIHMLERTGLGLKNGERVKLHTGTAEVQMRVFPLETRELNPGDHTWIALVADEPIAAAPGDPYIIRKLSPMRTVGGGRLEQADAQPRRPRKHVALQRLLRYQQDYPDAGYRHPEAARRLIERCLDVDYPYGLPEQELPSCCLLTRPALSENVARLEEERRILRIGRNLLLHTHQAEALCKQLETDIRKRFAQHETLIERASLAPRLPAILRDYALDQLAAHDLIEQRGDRILPPPNPRHDSSPEQHLAERILALYTDTGFSSPHPSELPSLLQAHPGKISPLLDMLIAEGRLIRLSSKVILARAHVIDAQQRVVEAIHSNGSLDSGDFKFMIHSTRKYALAILEHMDRTHVTLRIGNIRKLAPNHAQRMLKEL